MANEFVAKNGLISQNNTVVSGSLTVTGGITGSFSGSFTGTGSYADQALSSSYSQTASFAPAYLPLTGGTINGNVVLNGTASIAFLNVQYESASVIYSSGSNQFGDAANDTQTLYGAVVVPVGSLTVTGSISTTQGFTGSLQGTSSWASNAVTASYVSGSTFTDTNPALSASYALSASFAPATPTFPFVGTATVTGSLLVLGTGSVAFTAFTTSSVTSQSFFLIAGTVRNSGSATSSVYGVNISPTLQYVTQSQTATALRVQPTFISGSTAVSNSILNIIADLGTTGVGSQFVVNDLTSGSIYQINNVSGLPLVDVTSDSIFTIYNYPTKIFQTSGSAVTITGSLRVSGTLDATVTLASTASYINPTFISQSAAASGFGSGGGGGTGTGFPFSGSGVVTGSLLISGAIATEGLIVSGPIASTGTITAPTFAGSLSGNASSATNATNVSITDTTTNAEHYIAFTAASAGNQPIRVDSVGLLYNPSTEQLRVVGGVTSSFTGSLTGRLIGTSSWATNALTASYLDSPLTPGTPGGADNTYQIKQGASFTGSSVLTFINDTAGIRATGSFTGSLTGALIGTASWANNAVTASYVTSSFFAGINAALSASYATTSSFVLTASYAVNAATASYALGLIASASYAAYAATASYIAGGYVTSLVTDTPSNVTISPLSGQGALTISVGGTFAANGQILALATGMANLF